MWGVCLTEEITLSVLPAREAIKEAVADGGATCQATWQSEATDPYYNDQGPESKDSRKMSFGAEL